MEHSIKLLESRLSFINHHLKSVVTEVAKKMYTEEKEDLELAIHNLKMLESNKL